MTRSKIYRRLAAGALLALLLALTLVGSGSSSGGFERYHLKISIEGYGLARAFGDGPLEEGGIETAIGDMTAKFGSYGNLPVYVNPRTGQVQFPYPRGTGFAEALFGHRSSGGLSVNGGLSGAWGGIEGDSTETKGEYHCSFAVPPAQNLPKSYVLWTLYGPPTHGEIAVSFGVTQAFGSQPNNPKVSCDGYLGPRSDPIGEASVMYMTGLRGPDILRLPVKKLLRKDAANLTWKEPEPVVAYGSRTGSPLPMRDDGKDRAIFEVKIISAELSK